LCSFVYFLSSFFFEICRAKFSKISGIGKILMRQSIEELQKLFGKSSIKLGAQLYLKKFYESFGFVQSSEVYIEDGIPHIEMIRRE